MLPTRPGSVARWRTERGRQALRKSSCSDDRVGGEDGGFC